MEKKVIIIGSSSNVLKKELGSKIDEFDVIIRFNRAPTDDFEQYVGSKTTHRYVNMWVIRNIQRDNDDLEFVPNLRNQKIITDFNINQNDFKKYYHESCELNKFSRHDEFRKFKNNITKTPNFEKYKEYPGFEPSIGLGVIAQYLNQGYKPTLYGFHIDSDNYKVSPHYWKEKKGIGGAHDFKYERELIIDLIKHDIVKYLK